MVLIQDDKPLQYFCKLGNVNSTLLIRFYSNI